MAEALFNVVVQGRLLEGFDRNQVLLQLQQQLRLSDSKAQQLLGDKPLLVKQAVSRETAQAYCDRLNGLGIATTLQPVAHDLDSNPTVPYFTAHLPRRRSIRFECALWRAIACNAVFVLAYCTGVIVAVASLLVYLWSFSYLLTAPPILFSATLYFIPASLLTLFGIFIMRPLLPLRATSDTAPTTEAVSLSRFVEQLCSAISAPAPTEIRIDTSAGITVSALPTAKHFKAGAYALTVGLPALQLLPIPQLSAMMAKVLGIRARPAVVRSLALIDHLLRRLQRSLLNDDVVGKKLHALFSDSNPKPFLALLCKPLHFLLKISNQLFAVGLARLAKIDKDLSMAVDCEGDRYLLGVAGNAAFSQTLASWRRLEQAHANALHQNFDDWEGDGVADDFPALVRHYYFNDLSLNDGTPDASAQQAAQDNTQRLERCGAGIEPGIVDPAYRTATLSLDSKTLSFTATRDLYQRLRIADNRPRIPAEHKVLLATEAMQRAQRALTYFNGWFHPQRFWKLPDQALIQAMPLRDTAQQLNVCVNEIRRLTPDRQTLLAEYARLRQQIQELQIGQQVLGAGFAFQFRLAHYDTSALPAELAQRQQQLQHTEAGLAVQEEIMGGRIALGLRLCGQEMGDLYQTLVGLHPLGARLHKLELDTGLLDQLVRRRDLRTRHHRLTIVHLENKIDEAVLRLQQQLEKIALPFTHRHRTIGRWIHKALEHAEHDKAPLIRAQIVLGEIRALYEQLAQRAADHGVTAEEAYKIERIKLIASE